MKRDDKMSKETVKRARKVIEWTERLEDAEAESRAAECKRELKRAMEKLKGYCKMYGVRTKDGNEYQYSSIIEKCEAYIAGVERRIQAREKNGGKE